MYTQFQKKINFIQQKINLFNQNKLVLGIMMLLLNLGSKYVEIGLTKTQEQALRNGLGREVLIFAIVFMGTRDIVTSIILTASFIILSDYLLNEKSSMCLLPKSLTKVASEIDRNNDNKISLEEEQQALEILRKARTQRELSNALS